jgi:CHASE3 domain sensor protein
MGPMRSYLTSKITEGFWVIVVVLLGAGVLLFWTTRQLITTSAWVTHSNRVLAELDDIPLQLEKVQTAYHGYILTGDEDDLTL